MTSFDELSSRSLKAHPSLADAVLRELRRLIVGLELPPGTHLVETSLAERLGVSRNPVRAAIQTLAAEGFVAISPRRGAYVPRLAAKDVYDLFEVRDALEPLAAKLAARNTKPSDIGRLTGIVDQAHAALVDGRVDQLPVLVTRFHTTIVELADNAFLLSLAVPAIRRAQWVRISDLTQRAEHTWDEHAELAEAITQGNEREAESLARRHVSAARLAFSEYTASSNTSSKDPDLSWPISP